MATRVLRSESMPIRASEDIVRVRQAVRRSAVLLGFGLVDQTKIVTASSELARNTLDHGGGGTAQIEIVRNESREGARQHFAYAERADVIDMATAYVAGIVRNHPFVDGNECSFSN